MKQLACLSNGFPSLVDWHVSVAEFPVRHDAMQQPFRERQPDLRM